MNKNHEFKQAGYLGKYLNNSLINFAQFAQEQITYNITTKLGITKNSQCIRGYSLTLNFFRIFAGIRVGNNAYY